MDDVFLPQNPQSKHHNTNKKRLTQDQVRFLETTFTAHKKLEPELKLQLSDQLGVPPRQIAIWYQNKRARWKTQSLELDYNTLQIKLENALADRKRLEKEVCQLKGELRNVQEILFSLNHGVNMNNIVSCNSSCDEGSGGGGTSSLHEDVSGQVLLDELYACFFSSGSGGSTWL